LVQSHAVPKPDSPLSAVVVSGGKQYRVAPGDRILVDRMSAEPGSSVKLERVLLVADGGEVRVGSALVGVDIDARVIDHRRGPRIETLRYKSKKRVRVHRGGRAHLTALEIIAVGGVGLATEEEEEKPKVKGKEKGKETGQEKSTARGRVKAAPRAGRGAAEEKAAAKAEAGEETKEEEAPKRTARRRSKKATE
jgi:large subunit ribosomal protein L21